MTPARIIIFVFLVLIAWRLALAALHRSRIQEEAALQQRRKRATVPIAARWLEIGPRNEGPCDARDRAKSYLRRIVALTNATHVLDGYILNVGTAKFQVRHRYVKRLREVTDAKWMQEQTCFYSKQVMPEEEQIATVLLQLKNNPALFDKWAAWNGPIKSDGETFQHKD
jgi:hypothetical protein